MSTYQISSILTTVAWALIESKRLLYVVVGAALRIYLHRYPRLVCMVSVCGAAAAAAGVSLPAGTNIVFLATYTYEIGGGCVCTYIGKTVFQRAETCLFVLHIRRSNSSGPITCHIYSGGIGRSVGFDHQFPLPDYISHSKPP